MEDRRVVRSQTALLGALLELIVEKGYEATNISEISARANVGRSTFYAHYADKDDLLQGSVESLRAFLYCCIDEGGGDVHPALTFCLPMLEHADESRDLFAAIVGRRGGHLFQELVHDMWADLVRQRWPAGDELEVQALVGAFRSTLLWWLIETPKLSPVQVANRFIAMMTPALVG